MYQSATTTNIVKVEINSIDLIICVESVKAVDSRTKQGNHKTDPENVCTLLKKHNFTRLFFDEKSITTASRNKQSHSI